jgi:hypothetical protein
MVEGLSSPILIHQNICKDVARFPTILALGIRPVPSKVVVFHHLLLSEASIPSDGTA